MAKKTGSSAAKTKRTQPNSAIETKIASPFHVYFKGPATSVSANNKTGPFDVLPGHANFLTLLTAGTITVRTKHDKREFQIDSGVMHFYQDELSIFLDV